MSNAANRQIEQQIRRAYTNTAPDVLAGILQECEARKGSVIYMTKRNTAGRIAKRVASLAAALLLLVIGLAGAQSYQAMNSVYSTVALDVNPSVEILVNRKDKVLDVVAGNEDGRAVIGGMDFRNTSLELTVNALIGSMLKGGYLSETANSILISVDPGDEAHELHLMQVLEEEIGQTLTQNAFGAALMFQKAEKSEELTALAGEAGVSLGKAQLASSIASSNSLYSADELAKLSINELNLLTAVNEVAPGAVRGSGQASAKAYIGDEEALGAAMAHAGVPTGGATAVRSMLDYEDGRMVYEIEFVSGLHEYEYEIDALTGEIRKAERDLSGDQAVPAPSLPPTDEGLIGGDAAKDAALAHAGLSAGEISGYKCVLDREDGRMVYEIEFYAGYTEYDYEIDALTGEVLKAEKDFDDDAWRAAEAAKSAAVSESTKASADEAAKAGASADGYIGAGAAKSRALGHAGVSSSDARGLQAELDREDGRMVYEVEFKAGGYEYEYEIDAQTGSVLKADKEWDD